MVVIPILLVDYILTDNKYWNTSLSQEAELKFIVSTLVMLYVIDVIGARVRNDIFTLNKSILKLVEHKSVSIKYEFVYVIGDKFISL